MQTIRLSDCVTHLAVHKGSNSWAAVMKPLKPPQATANLQQGARRTNHGIKESGMLFLYVQCGDLGCMHTMRQADVGHTDKPQRTERLSSIEQRRIDGMPSSSAGSKSKHNAKVP